MEELNATLIAALGGAALLVALAFRYMTNTLITLNDELQQTIAARRADETERDALKTRVAELESQITVLQTQIETQSRKIDELHQRLTECHELLVSVRAVSDSL